MKIKDLPKIDRPREKLEKYGPERLSDSELLAILLRTGSEGNERNQMKQFLADYERWQNESGDFDPVKSQRQRDASFNLAMIIIGLPLYLFHWRIIKKETKSV